MGRKLALILVLVLLTLSLVNAQGLITEEFSDYKVTAAYFEQQVLGEKNVLKFQLTDESIKSISIEWSGDLENFCVVGECFLTLNPVKEASLDEEGFMILELDGEMELGDFIYPAGASMTIDLAKGDVVVLDSSNPLTYVPTNGLLIAGEGFFIDDMGYLNGEFSYNDIDVNGRAIVTANGINLFKDSWLRKEGFLISTTDSVFVPNGNEFFPIGENQFVIKGDGFSAVGSNFNIEIENNEYVPEENDFLSFKMNGGTLDVIKGDVLKTSISGDVSLTNGNFELYKEMDDIFYSEEIGPSDSVAMDVEFIDSKKNVLICIEDNKVNLADSLIFTENDIVKLRLTPEDQAFEYLFAPIEDDEFVIGTEFEYGTLGYYQVLAVQRAMGVEETGTFDTATANALKEWQENYNKENKFTSSSDYFVGENGVWNDETRKAYLESLGNKGLLDNKVLLALEKETSGLFGPEKYFAEVALGEADAYCGYDPEFYKPGEPKCALYVSEFHESAFGVNPEESGVYGDAPTMADNILAKGGEELFHYKEDGLGAFDMENLKPGDVIFLRRENFEQYYAERNCGQADSDCIYDETFLNAGYSHVGEYIGKDEEGNHIFTHYYGLGVPSVDRFDGDKWVQWQVARVVRPQQNSPTFTDPRHEEYQTVGVRITQNDLLSYDTVSSMYDSMIESGQIDLSPEEKEQLIVLAEDINNMGSPGKRTRVLEENTLLYLPTTLADVEAPDYYQAAVLQSTVEEINPTPEWSFLLPVQKEVLKKEIRTEIATVVENDPKLRETFTNSLAVGTAMGSAITNAVDYQYWQIIDQEKSGKYQTDSPIEFSQLMTAIAIENKFGQEEVPGRVGYYGMSPEKMLQIAQNLEEEVNEELIIANAQNPIKSTRYLANNLYNIGEYYATNREGYVEFNEENIDVIASAYLTDNVRPRNAALQDSLIELGYLGNTFTDSKGQVWDSRDGIISGGGSSYNALLKFAEDYAAKNGLDADDLKQDVEKINSERFISTQLYAALKEDYKQTKGSELPLGIVPKQAKLGSGESIEDVVNNIVNYYLKLDEKFSKKGL